MSNCTDSSNITAYLRWFLNTLTRTMCKPFFTYTLTGFIIELRHNSRETAIDIGSQDYEKSAKNQGTWRENQGKN